MNRYVPGVGNPNAKILIIGEAPSFEEEANERPFVGSSGRILDELLKNSGIHRSQCWVTNVFKYMIMPQVKKGKPIPAFVRAEQAGINVQESIQHLRIEIDDINPNVIVGLGGTSLWALRGTDKIQTWRGSILSAWNRKCIFSYHPASLIHGEESGHYWWKYIIEFDLRRAKAQSEFSAINRTSRNLYVCRNSAQLWEFYQRGKEKARRLKRSIKLSVDIEAIMCIPVCIGLSFDKTEGISVPIWNHTSKFRVSDIPSSDLASMWIMLDQILNDPDFLIIGQNFKYDQDKINRLGFTIKKLFSDTMLKAFAINPEFPTNLAFNTSIYTEEPYYKDEGSEFEIGKQPIEDLFVYNARDAAVTLEIDDAMDTDLDEIEQRPFYENFIMDLHDLYLHTERNGFEFDEQANLKLLQKYIAWCEKLRFERWQLCQQHINVNSWKQVDVMLYEVMGVPRRQGTGEEVLTGLLNIVKKKDQKEMINNILEERRVNKTISTYLLPVRDFDGKIRTSFYPCLETGRTSTNLMEPPVRPWELFRDPEDNKAKKKAFGSAFQVLTKHGDVGGDIREQYVPRKGHVLVNIDSNQAEARVIARLANDEKMLKLYDTNDVHALTASWFLGGDEAQWSKKVLGYECPQRFLGKTLRHAGHLGAKKKRAATEVNTSARKYHIDISVNEAFTEKALIIFHKKSPNIQGVFHAEVINSIGRNRILIAPLPFGIEAKFGGRRTFYERWGDELFRQAFSYLPQRAISDNTKGAAIRIRRIIKEIRLIVESHDALTFEVPEFMVDEWAGIFKSEMERPIRFENCSLSRADLVIPSEIEIGYNYKDFNKYKRKVA